MSKTSPPAVRRGRRNAAPRKGQYRRTMVSRLGFRPIYGWLLGGIALMVVGLFVPWARVSATDIPDLPGFAYDIPGNAPGAGGWLVVALVVTTSIFGLIAIFTRAAGAARVAAVCALLTLVWGAARALRLRAEVRSLQFPDFGSEGRLSWGVAVFVGGAAMTLVAAAIAARRSDDRERVVTYDERRATREDAQWQ